MFLKSLSMKGFKSFADPTVLAFEPGITVVVGPNGSGKSNVVDAVTWVLGAQGPRSLRSQKMEDVIFAGTASRPALGRAEVSLTIDNASGKLPVEMAEVTITRTLFRSGESEYAINGAGCRLLDIQELLSDSGVGRQQHMIIGQGQLDTVLNARPEDRRAIVEEAAGVLKHRRRRERAERRLAATHENLDRLGDLVREVRRQIRPLERQAAAARSHASLSAELRAVRLHVAAGEIASMGGRRAEAAAAQGELSSEEQRLTAGIAELDRSAAATAAELSSRREEDLASALGRLQGLVERSRGTGGVLRERRRALAAALDAAADVDVVSTLEAEAARLAAELHAADDDEAALAPEAAAVVERQQALVDDEATHAAEWADVAGLGAAQQAVGRTRSRIELLGRAIDQARVALTDLDDRLEALDGRAGVLAAADHELAGRTAEAGREAERLASVAREAEAEVAAAAAAAAEAERAAGQAEQQRHRSAARAEALARALHELEGAGGRAVLAGVEGVVGSLVDLVEIDHGWEAAFEAAAGAAISAVVVDGRDAARQALARLHGEGATGALLAARTATPPAPSWSGATGRPEIPAAAEWLRPHVRLRRVAGRPELEGVLDALVGGAVRVGGWEEAVDLALDHPELVVVTVHGDRFAASGWRIRSNQGVVTAAAVEEAERVAADQAAAADRAARVLDDARRALDAARQASVAAARAQDRHEAAAAALTVERQRVAEEHARVLADLGSTRRTREGLAEQSAADAAERRALEEALPELEAASAAAAERAELADAARAALDERRAEVAAMRHQLEVRTAGIAERRQVLTQRRAEVERRLQGHAEERRQAAERRQRLEAEGTALERLEALVDAERARLGAALEALRADYRHQVDAVRAGGERLEALRRTRAADERRLDEVRGASRRLDLEIAELTMRLDAVRDGVRELGADPDHLDDEPAPTLPEGVGAAAHAASLAEKLGARGPGNPLALEELSVLEDRHRQLDAQVEDIRRARRELQEVVRTLDQEIMTSFAAAAADVNEHFSSLVSTLFPGGTGRLTLTEPDDLLHTGVEVEVRPAGRNVRRVSLLSGGERALAALAFLFAVFRSRPSPFYLMDEVEAALDDVNLHRFLGLVHEFRDEAQLIIVSHQKRTMETADALYGVTMAPGGSSQVVSQKVRKPTGAAAS
ncbi:MAG: chromosome segregation protein SMC [Acidimicrobiales bacterium]